MPRVTRAVLVGLLAGLIALFTSPVAAQVGPSAYGEGQGVTGARALPRTGGELDMMLPSWTLIILAAVGILTLSLIALKSLNGRFRAQPDRGSKGGGPRIAACLATTGAIASLLLGNGLAGAAAAQETLAQPTACTIGGTARQLAPTLADFAPTGDGFVKKEDAGYYGGRGYFFSYDRTDYASYATSPLGGYLTGGVVIASDAARAGGELTAATSAWTAGGGWARASAPLVGDETIAYTRSGGDHAQTGESLTEVYLGFRRCNATTHLMLLVNAKFDPIAVAARYANLVVARMAVEQPAAQPPPQAAPTPAGCRLSGPPQRYALTLDDFGRKGSYVAMADPGYWDGTGFGFGYNRDEWELAQAQPLGAYLFGGAVVSVDEATSASMMQFAVEGWTSSGDFQRVEVARIGDSISVSQRLTPFEGEQETPLKEVFLAFRRCNVNVHFLLATMPEFDAVAQALRYARLVESRMTA